MNGVNEYFISDLKTCVGHLNVELTYVYVCDDARYENNMATHVEEKFAVSHDDSLRN